MIAARCLNPLIAAVTRSGLLGLHLCGQATAAAAARHASKTAAPPSVPSSTAEVIPSQVQSSSDGPSNDGVGSKTGASSRPKWPQQRSQQHNNNTSSSSSQGPKHSRPAWESIVGSSSTNGSKPAAKEQHGPADVAAVGRAGNQHSSKHRPWQSSARQPHTTQRQGSPQQWKQDRWPGQASSAAAAGRQGGQQTRVTPRLLTAWLKAATSPERLLHLLQQHAADLDHIHLSAAYTQAVQVCRQQGTATAQQLLAELHQLAVRLQQQCEARQLANIIHSCSKLSSPATATLLLPLFLRDSTLQQAKPQEVSYVLWAAATLQLQLTGVQLQQLMARLTEVLHTANPQEVSNTLWAVATMGQQVPPLQLQQLLGRFVAVLADAKPQEVSNTLWAVATMGQQVPPQQLQLLAAFGKLLPTATPQNVANLLWACGKMQYLPLQLLQSLQHHNPQQLQQVLAAAKPQELANMAWACGQWGYRGQLLPGAALQQAVKLLLQSGATGSLNSQDLCNLCWSAAVLDLQQCVPQVLQLVAAAGQVFSTASEENLQQLHQVHLWLLDSQLPTPGQGLLGVLTQQQLEQCRGSREKQLTAMAKKQPSRTQQSVYAAVLQLPPDTWQQQQPPQSEQPTDDSACLMDIAAVTASGVKVTIEVEGPQHFVQPDNTLSGPTLSRNRALEARGIALISIPYWEWGVLRSTAQQQKYLLAKLQAVQQQRPAAVPWPPAAAAGGQLEGGSHHCSRRRQPLRVDPGNNPQGM